jgi:hypothetical protein
MTEHGYFSREARFGGGGVGGGGCGCNWPNHHPYIMIANPLTNTRCRTLTTRLGSVLLLFQRTPPVQMIFPEARILAGANFCARATNSLGSDDSNVATITVITPPGITTQPASVTINSGQTANLSVTTSGTSPAFQWYEGPKGNTTSPVSGAMSSGFTTPTLTTNHTYWVRASNAAGSVDSNAATVTVPASKPVADWKAQQFNSTQLAEPLISGDNADPDADGITNRDEFIHGLSPLVRDPGFPSMLGVSGNQLTVSFVAKLATGVGYSGMTRHDAIETGSDLNTTTWTSPSGYADITGNDQSVNYSVPLPNPASFYRLRVWLTP